MTHADIVLTQAHPENIDLYFKCAFLSFLLIISFFALREDKSMSGRARS
jgi:hypothetical protein